MLPRILSLTERELGLLYVCQKEDECFDALVDSHHISALFLTL